MKNQEYINGLIGELEQELMVLDEEHCSSCSNNMNIALCEGCDVRSHKRDLEELIASLREE